MGSIGSLDSKPSSKSTVSFNDSSFTIPTDAYSSLSAPAIYPQRQPPAHRPSEEQQQQGQSTLSPATLLRTLSSALNDFSSSPKTQNLIASLRRFATAHPHLTALLLLNILLSGPAILIFALVIASTACFALFWGLLLGVLGSAAVIAAVVGLGLCILLPTLCLTVIGAVALWCWGCVAWWGWQMAMGNSSSSKADERKGEEKEEVATARQQEQRSAVVEEEESGEELVAVGEVKSS